MLNPVRESSRELSDLGVVWWTPSKVTFLPARQQLAISDQPPVIHLERNETSSSEILGLKAIY